jgi:hypothetical protein
MGTARQRVYTFRMLAFRDDDGRINKHKGKRTNAAGKLKCHYRSASYEAEEKHLEPTGKTSGRLGENRNEAPETVE